MNEDVSLFFFNEVIFQLAILVFRGVQYIYIYIYIWNQKQPFLKWLFQLDDLEALLGKRVVSPFPSILNWFFGVLEPLFDLYF